ncbi:MAG: diaminobutyrate--2-oxoglutarate transaminase [Candidatus Hydrogenedentes bacterium]|nr:diaminobutyrate--2-oxoglutarate transaminase [Candidatus Hydrogenedentota bacterium]
MQTLLHEASRASSKSIFTKLESNVRGYCRNYPSVFSRAQNAILIDEGGREYVDFLAGAGTLNYGHNNPYLKEVLLHYIAENGVTHGLDLYTTAKRDFLEAFQRFILAPREMSYKIQFTGPTGTNAVEAALKIARNLTGRANIVSFTNSFHGVTLGSLAVTGNSYYRDASGVPAYHSTFMPYDGYFGESVDTLSYLERMITDTGSGVDLPAAVIVETIQGEGGVNEASYRWLRGLQHLCNEHGILMIIDDIQTGIGRTGPFFSFEDAQISPDIITLSKSLSGYGLPLSIVLMKPSHDAWKPGQHNGTFRGNSLAFVTATEMLSRYWRDSGFNGRVQQKSWKLGSGLHRLRERYPGIVGVRGRGLLFGVECASPELAECIRDVAFQKGLIVETCGPRDHVVKLLPPLTVEPEVLDRGLALFEEAVDVAHLKQSPGRLQGDL